MNNYVGTLDRNVLYKQKNETFDMFSTIVEQDLTNTSLQVIKVVDNISTYITPSNPSFSIFKDLTKYTIVMPGEDCFVCVIFNNSSIMFRVGEPPLLLLIYKPGLNTDQFINLVQYNDDGDTLFDETMTPIGYGLYSADFAGRNTPSDFLAFSVTDINKTIYHKLVARIKNYNIIDPVDTTTLQTIYYDWE